MLFDVIAENAAVIFTMLIVLWIAQFGMAYLQMRRFYKRLAHVKRNGVTAIGMCGDRFKGRNYAVLTVDQEGNIVHAEQFSGWTVFARLRPQPALEGLTLAQVRNENLNLPISARILEAFQNAADDLWVALYGEQEEEEAIAA